MTISSPAARRSVRISERLLASGGAWAFWSSMPSNKPLAKSGLAGVVACVVGVCAVCVPSVEDVSVGELGGVDDGGCC